MHRARHGVRRHRRPQVRQRRAQRAGTRAARPGGRSRQEGGQGEMRVSKLIEKIEPFYVMEVAKAASQMAREVAHSSKPMIFLNIGEPDFTAPPLVQEAAQRALDAGRAQYTHAVGLDSVREKI